MSFDRIIINQKTYTEIRCKRCNTDLIFCVLHLRYENIYKQFYVQLAKMENLGRRVLYILDQRGQFYVQRVHYRTPRNLPITPKN